MGLAYIGRVTKVENVDNADNLQRIEVVCGKGGRWSSVARKGSFTEGDLCRVFLQDSILPTTDEFSFMEPRGYRVRMTRLRGVPSECLVMPYTLHTILEDVGTDITDLEGVSKYEKPLPTNLSGNILGPFPSFIPKTDEPNFQSVPEMVRFVRGQEVYATVKVDGSSGTFYRYSGHTGVCSRNWELKEDCNNVFGACVKTHFRDIPNGYAVQFEVAGPGIQKNPLGLKNIQPFVFQVYDIVGRGYLDLVDLLRLCRDYNLPLVESIPAPSSEVLGDSDLLRAYAEGVYPNGRQREGVVVRPVEEYCMPTGERVSFKVINLLYKD